MIYTKADAVAVELGRTLEDLSPAEQAQINTWIRRVEDRIARRIPNLAERVEDVDYLETLTDIVADVVARRARNPEGMRTERIDDYYYDRGSQTADLMLTDAEWIDLGAFTVGDAWSTRPSFVPDGSALWL